MKELELSDAFASDETESRVENLPAVAKEAEEAWAKIEQSNLGDRMKRALRRIAGGGSIRGSAEAEGYSSHADVYRYAKQFGIVDVRTRKLIDTHRKVARLSGEELEQRLATHPEEISTHALAVIGGVATDKVLAHEKSQTDDGASYLSALEKVAAEIAASGKSLELKVSVGPTLPAANASGSHEVIDVTPERPI
jgi:hypothetical protein